MGRSRPGKGGGFSVISLLGQGVCIIHMGLCAGPCVHGDVYTPVYTRICTRSELWWAEVKLFYKRALERT